MHDAQRAGEPFVLQIKIERFQLRGGQHALVDEGPPREAREVDGLAARTVLTGAFGAQFVFGPLAHHIRPTLQIHSGGAADERLPEGGHGVAGESTQRRVIGGHVAPAEQTQPLGGDNSLEGGAGGRGVTGGLRQECDAGGVGTLGGQLEVDHRPKELIGDADHDAGPVAAIGLGSGGAAMLEVQQRCDRVIDDVPATPAVDVHDHGHAARIMFVRGVVEPDTAGHTHLTLHNISISHGTSTTASRPAGDPPCVGERRPFCGLQQVGETIGKQGRRCQIR